MTITIDRLLTGGLGSATVGQEWGLRMANVRRSGNGAVYGPVSVAVYEAVHGAVSGAVYDAVTVAVYGPVSGAVYVAVNGAVRGDIHG